LAWLLAGLAVFTGILALGKYTPLFPWLYAYFPGFNRFRGTCKFLFLTLFCGAGLSAFGYQALEHDIRRKSRSTLLIIAGLAGVLMFFLGLSIWYMTGDQGQVLRETILANLNGPDNYGLDRQTLLDPGEFSTTVAALQQQFLLVAIFLGGAVLCIALAYYRHTIFLAGIPLLVFIDLLLFNAPFLTSFPSASLFKPEVAAVAPIVQERHLRLDLNFPWGSPNWALLHRVPCALGYESNGPEPISRLFQSLQNATDPLAIQRGNWLSLERAAPIFSIWGSFATGTPRVDIPTLPRLRFVSQARFFPDHQTTEDFVRHESWDPFQVTLLQASTPAPLATFAPEAATMSITTHTPEYLSLNISASRPQIVFFGETFLPGWSARIDGEPAPIIAANRAFQAVRLPTGTHVLEWRYDPPGLMRGLLLSLLGVLSLLGLIFWDRRVSFSTTTPPHPEQE
jgi:hypothetical protein